MSDYRLTPEARTDLIESRRYTLEKWGAAQSQKYLSELGTTLHVLAGTPALGRARADLGSDVFSFPHVSHAIYYVVHEERLVVFAVLHKRMVPRKHLGDRERM